MLDETHAVSAALARGELNDDEAYFVLRFAGHHGYREAIRRLNPDPWWRRARRWLVWFGGWEAPHLSQWDRGLPAFKIKGSPTPLSLFGHRVTFQWFGFTVDLPGRLTRLCVYWRSGHSGPRIWRVFLSPDSTSSSATHWFIGRRPWKLAS